MQVLLINPPSISPNPVMPLGLMYLAAALEKNSISVEIIDAWVSGLNFTALEKRISNAGSPDLIGITVMSPTYMDGIKTIQTAKKASPSSKIIVGGVHPSALPEQCLLDNPELDFVAVGEGEELIVKLVKMLNNKTNPLKDIKGLVYRSNGIICNNGCAEPIKDLDSLPFPARHLVPIFKYRSHPPYRLYRSYATMITGRGCPFHCTYCTKSVSGNNFRFQSPEYIVREIEHIVETYNIRQIHFYDDIFTFNKKHVESICDIIISSRIKIIWSCITRVDLVNETLLKKMRAAGCWLIAFGVESGNQAILDNIKKGYRVKQIEEAFAITKGAGIRTLGYFMAGLPGETYSTLNDTVKLSLSLDADFISWSVTALYPGSELYRETCKDNLSDDKGEDLTVIPSMSPYAHGSICVYHSDLPCEYLFKMIQLSYRKFYFKTSRVLDLVKNLHSFEEFLSYVRVFFHFVYWRIRSLYRDI